MLSFIEVLVAFLLFFHGISFVDQMQEQLVSIGNWLVIKERSARADRSFYEQKKYAVSFLMMKNLVHW